MLHLLVDTSVWLDLARRRDGQKLIHAIGQVVLDGDVELLVPALILDEFERNRERVEESMSKSVAERFRLLKKDVDDFGTEGHKDLLDSLAHEIPLIGAMTTRNFRDIAKLLGEGRRLEPTEAEHARVVQRGLDKRAPFRRPKNSVADALLIELYSTATAGLVEGDERYAFITSNYDDFSVPKGNRQQPHPDIADLFPHTSSRYFYQVDGLDAALAEYLGEEFKELLGMSDFQEEPRTLAEIIEAEQEFFDRVWYDRSLNYTHRYETGQRDERDTEESYRVSIDAQERFTTRRSDLKPAESDYELGMWNGKLSTLRWVLGSEWDFLDT